MSRPPRDIARDGGFTIIEAAVSIALVAVVMTAITAYFVATTQITARQNDTEAAVHLATAALSRARSIRGSALPYGRDAAGTDAQWNAPAPGVAPYLVDSIETWDSTAAAGSGATAPLPTTPQQTVVTGTTYSQSWYVGTCWQVAATGACGAVAHSGDVPMIRVVVAVTWTDRGCPASGCSYVASTLVSSAPTDPVFNTN